MKKFLEQLRQILKLALINTSLCALLNKRAIFILPRETHQMEKLEKLFSWPN